MMNQRPTRIALCFAAFAAAVCGLPIRALAEPTGKDTPPKVDPAAAEVLFEQGRAALESRDYPLACEKFRESYRLEPAAGTVMNWATCEEKLNRLASAWQHWREAIARLPPGDERVAYAEGQQRRLSARLAHLTLDIAADAPLGTHVERDGVELGAASLDVSLPVDPGQHHIVARAPNREPVLFTVVLGEGESRSLMVAPGPESRLNPTTAEPTHSVARGHRSFAPGLIVGGVGLAGIGVAVVTGSMLPAKQRTVDQNCTGNLCNQAGLKAASDGRRLVVINTASWVVGAVGLGLGTYLTVSARGERPGDEHRPTGSLAIVPNAGGLTMSYARQF